MAEEKKENQEQQVETPVVETPATPAPTASSPEEDEWMGAMENKYPDLKGNRAAIFKKSKESYDEQHEELKGARQFIKKANDEADELSTILQSDPDLNAAFTAIYNKGTRPVIAFIKNLRPLLKDYAEGKISDEEVEAALQEEEAAQAASDAKSKMQQDAFEAECEERGVDVKETLEKFNDIFNRECKTPEECRDQVKAFFKVLDFDDAVAAAETRGRNAKIKEERRNHAPGVPASSPMAAPQAPAPKSKSAEAADRAAAQRRMFEA